MRQQPVHDDDRQCPVLDRAALHLEECGQSVAGPAQRGWREFPEAVLVQTHQVDSRIAWLTQGKDGLLRVSHLVP